MIKLLPSHYNHREIEDCNVKEKSTDSCSLILKQAMASNANQQKQACVTNHQMVNHVRKLAGLLPLARSPELDQAAKMRAEQMTASQSLEHQPKETVSAICQTEYSQENVVREPSV